MFPNPIKSLVFLVLCGIIAVLVGKLVGQGDYGSLLMLSYAALALFVFLAPGYLPLLALGLLNPFVLPIPFVFRFPFLILMLGVCLLKLVFRNALTHAEFRPTPLVSYDLDEPHVRLGGDALRAQARDAQSLRVRPKHHRVSIGS